MKVLFWSETFWPRVGGVENLAARLLPELQSRGNEFVVITWVNTRQQDEISYHGIPVYRFPFFSRGLEHALDPTIDHLHAVARLKREFAPDLVHINSYGRSAWFHLATENAHRSATLLTLHALPDRTALRGTLAERLFNSVDRVTCCSTAVLEAACSSLPEIRPRIGVVHNAVDVSTFNPSPISCEPPRLLFIGHLIPEKGLDWALAAAADVFKRFPSAQFSIAGDGPERARLELQTADLGLTPFVKFLGAVPQESIPSLIDGSTVVIIPSRVEGFSLVALEAALMGRPVVGTRTGGLPEVVIHEQTGLLIEPGITEQFAKAIAFLLDRPNVMQSMGQAAREHAMTRFNWGRYVDAYDGLYRQLAAPYKATTVAAH